MGWLPLQNRIFSLNRVYLFKEFILPQVLQTPLRMQSRKSNIWKEFLKKYLEKVPKITRLETSLVQA